MVFNKKIVCILLTLGCVFKATAAAQTNHDNVWLQQALKLQREIDVDAPLNQATFIGTHNSYNSQAYQIPVTRYLDPNQALTIRQQLEAGVRSIELDAHWTFNDTFKKTILLCHGQNTHLGCSLFDKPFADGLLEIKSWLKENPNELILLYIERHLDGHENELIAELEKYLGDIIFKPSDLAPSTSYSCMPLPTQLSKRFILSTGKQVVIVTKDCLPASKHLNQAKWQDTIFTGIGTIDKTPYTFLDATITSFTPYPRCAHDTIFNTDLMHTSLWRIFEDRTQIGSVIFPEKKLLPEHMQELAHCGINWPTLDFLHWDDPRLQAAIWSWKPTYPQADAGNCAIYRYDEGYENVDCHALQFAFACQIPEKNEWRVTQTTASWDQGERVCQTTFGTDWHFAVPINGAQLFTLKEQVYAQNLSAVWLNYASLINGSWVANPQKMNDQANARQNV